MPSVSVIITTWNRSRLLKAAIESVLAQTFHDFELIILDNSSTDDTGEIIRTFHDARIRYIRHEPLGISQARNLGVREAKAPIFGFFDDDDVWLPEKLEKQTALFRNSGDRVGMVYGGFYRIRSTGEVYDEFQPKLRGDALAGYLCDRDPLTGSASNPLIRKTAWAAVSGYDENLKTSEDWEFYLRLMRKFEVDFVPEPLLKIRTHGGARLGDRVLDAAAAEIRVCEEFEDVLKHHPRAYSGYLQAIGGKYCRAGKFREGRGYLWRAIGTYPLNGVAYMQYLFSFFGSSFYRGMHRVYKKAL